MLIACLAVDSGAWKVRINVVVSGREMRGCDTHGSAEQTETAGRASNSCA